MSAGRRFSLTEMGLLIVMVLAPLCFGAVYPWAFMTLAAALFCLAFFRRRALLKAIKIPRFFSIGLSVVFVWMLLQVFLVALNGYGAGIEWIKWLAAAIGFLMIQNLRRGSVQRLLMAVLWLGIFESAYGLWEVSSGHEAVLWHTKTAYEGYVTGTYLNRNHFAGLLEICLGVQLGLCLSALNERRVYRWAWLSGAFLIVLTAFFKTGSRAGILCFLLSLMGGVIIFFLRERRMRWLPFTVLAVIFVMAFTQGANTAIARFFEPHAGGFERLTVWSNGLNLWRDYAWCGTGFGAFEWIFPKYQPQVLAWGYAHAHNDYLELLIALGLPACLLLFVSFGFFLIQIFQKTRNLEKKTFCLVWGALVGGVSFLMHGFVDFNFAIPANAWLFIFILGLIWRLIVLSRHRRGHDHA